MTPLPEHSRQQPNLKIVIQEEPKARIVQVKFFPYSRAKTTPRLTFRRAPATTIEEAQARAQPIFQQTEVCHDNSTGNAENDGGHSARRQTETKTNKNKEVEVVAALLPPEPRLRKHIRAVGFDGRSNCGLPTFAGRLVWQPSTKTTPTKITPTITNSQRLFYSHIRTHKKGPQHEADAPQ